MDGRLQNQKVKDRGQGVASIELARPPMQSVSSFMLFTFMLSAEH